MVPSQPFRQADTFKIAVERPFRHGFIGQGGQHFLRQRLPGRQVNHPDDTAIHRIAKKQDVKIRMLHILVHAAFTQVIPGIGFKIYMDRLHFFLQSGRRRQPFLTGTRLPKYDYPAIRKGNPPHPLLRNHPPPCSCRQGVRRPGSSAGCSGRRQSPCSRCC